MRLHQAGHTPPPGLSFPPGWLCLFSPLSLSNSVISCVFQAVGTQRQVAGRFVSLLLVSPRYLMPLPLLLPSSSVLAGSVNILVDYRVLQGKWHSNTLFLLVISVQFITSIIFYLSPITDEPLWCIINMENFYLPLNVLCQCCRWKSENCKNKTENQKRRKLKSKPVAVKASWFRNINSGPISCLVYQN